MRKKLVLGAALALAALAMPSTAQRRRPPDLRPLPARLTSATLETFSGEAEFRRYLRAIKREAERRGQWWGLRQDQDPPCTNPDDCPTDNQILVTGSRAAPPPSITNNQEAGVDEGDIVKQIGPFLLVLQDGRIFTVDTRRPAGLTLVDRVNVYRDAEADTWYDEMLVQDDHVIVTGYSYEDEATEVSVFRLDAAGKLSSEGVFLLSSNDYYDTDNYATRLVGDTLVVYSPLALNEVDPDEPFKWPVVRRWMPEHDRDDARAQGRALFDARAIYKPVQPTIEPVVHTVSVCPIGPIRAGRDMRCRSTAMIGPADRQFYVTPTDVFLWVMPSGDEYGASTWAGTECDRWDRRGPAEAHPATLFRVPIAGGEPSAIHALGYPIDQFSFDVTDGHFRALLAWEPIICGQETGDMDDGRRTVALQLLDISLGSLSDTPGAAPRRAYSQVPSIRGSGIENRFTDRYLVYGSRQAYYPRLPDADAPPISSTVVAVPLAAPAGAVSLPLPHDVGRLERIGNDVVLTGYRDHRGLNVSILDLTAAPRLAPPIVLTGRVESEGRSHAFNSLIESDGHGMFGIPTVAVGDSNNWAWRSAPSDVSFFTLDRARNAAWIGELTASPAGTAVDPAYQCEVSCIDWYGNSRPIFTGGRIFALSGTELVEGRAAGGRIAEVRRLNLSRPLNR